ncbi:hypothetical protein C1645_781386 [Glomus cerebriforme]|uniref:Uncharacterized protein n=1 Tax=Glomus cerebriforme TaxID=658196 RepID=A0A397SNM3_9GLOM|nr:hypothetical protein C1645_781386 [Glomus cerebriforme]
MSENKTSWTLKNTIGGLMGTMVVILIFACPALEITKIILFKLANNEIIYKNYIIEYIYFVMMITFPLGLLFSAIRNRCCNMKGLLNYIREQLFCIPFLILIVSIIYTQMTSHEIKPIPDSCPSSYPYKLSITRTACIIRLINFIIMWTFTSLLVILSIVDCFGYFPRKEKDKTIDTRLSGFFPPDRDDEMHNKGKP